MERRNMFKTLAMGTLTPGMLLRNRSNDSVLGGLKKVFGLQTPPHLFQSQWNNWPDMEWVGPEYWGNRLQDWQLRGGKLRCSVSDNNRTLHCLTHRLADGLESFETTVGLTLNNQTASAKDYIGFRLGAKGNFDDYRSAAVFGKGLNIGITTKGSLFIGNKKSADNVVLDQQVTLKVAAIPKDQQYTITLYLLDKNNGELITSLEAENVDANQLVGNIALVSHFESEQATPTSASVHYSDWNIKGEKVSHHPDREFGPVCFAQYTLHKKVLKLTAQLAPVEAISNHKVHLQVKRGYRWTTIQTTTVDPRARTSDFRIEDWTASRDIPYRVKVDLPLKSGSESFYYEGTIAADPVTSDQLKAAVFSCNTHYGFPNTEVVKNVGSHRPDVAVFLGDQIYESHGGFGIQRAPLDKACLDYLRKWYMFGWSYRDIFRDIPCAIIPDDHDVYHGNLWGDGGARAPVEEGYGGAVQRKGGYKMPPEWVNAVQRTQTANLPDPYDSTPVKQDISVYYTDWTYGGVSFAILEDRKFKGAPTKVLPKKSKEEFLKDSDLEIKDYYDVDANLLGKRQLDFLEHWSADWSEGAQMKALLSQTPFNSLHTSPAKKNIYAPSFRIPEAGEYVEGDEMSADVDSGGWPKIGRDKALRRLRKGFAFHIAGDQHLGSMVQYGIDEYGDAGFAFAGPALNNIWPRRWWPQVDQDHQSLPGRPKNTGNFTDSFGNRMTVYATANPVQTNREPAIIYDRATGYGIVTFDKTERTICTECWPRYVDPAANPEGQYDGWPIVVSQQDSYGRRPVTHLPVIEVSGLPNPVVKVYNQDNEELIYALRIKGQSFRPKVFERTTYRVEVGDPDRNEWKIFDDISPTEREPLKCDF